MGNKKPDGNKRNVYEDRRFMNQQQRGSQPPPEAVRRRLMKPNRIVKPTEDK
jgi:hypothetical protein